MALGGNKEPPRKVTVLRIIFSFWTVGVEAKAEVSEACVEAPVRHLFAVGADNLVEAALVYLAFAASLLSSSFISG